MNARSIGAVLGGIVAVFVLSLGIDEILHLTGVYPPWSERMSDALFSLATSYRIVIGVVGGYVTARLAPRAPMRHALIMGGIGLGLSLVGVIISSSQPNLGPLWYPLALAVTALPCAWAGGALYRPRSSSELSHGALEK